jgi:hypothetical protein
MKILAILASIMCWQGDFDPNRFQTEEWVWVAVAGDISFFRNKLGNRPLAVAVVVSPYTNKLLAYAYLCGTNVEFYQRDNNCFYRKEVPQDMADWMKLQLIYASKEWQCKGGDNEGLDLRPMQGLVRGKDLPLR